MTSTLQVDLAEGDVMPVNTCLTHGPAGLVVDGQLTVSDAAHLDPDSRSTTVMERMKTFTDDERLRFRTELSIEPVLAVLHSTQRDESDTMQEPTPKATP